MRQAGGPAASRQPLSGSSGEDDGDHSPGFASGERLPLDASDELAYNYCQQIDGAQSTSQQVQHGSYNRKKGEEAL